MGETSARGLSFDDAMGLLVDADPASTRLTFERGVPPEVAKDPRGSDRYNVAINLLSN